MHNKILVLGIGNYLMGDEGIGVHVANTLMSENILPAGVDIMDGGTGGFHLLEYFEAYEIVILIDATLDDQPVGSIRLIRPRYASDFPIAMSTHDIGLKDLVGALQLLGTMPDLHLFTVSIKTIQQQGTELTGAMEIKVPDIINEVCKLTNSLVGKSKTNEPAVCTEFA